MIDEEKMKQALKYCKETYAYNDNNKVLANRMYRYLYRVLKVDIGSRDVALEWLEKGDKSERVSN